MSTLSTHVLDTARGMPASGLTVHLAQRAGDGWSQMGSAETDDDGRVGDLAGGAVGPGVYRLVFDTGVWFDARGVDGFYPEAAVVFTISEPDAHYHVPLLLSPFGYSTYRGS